MQVVELSLTSVTGTVAPPVVPKADSPTATTRPTSTTSTMSTTSPTVDHAALNAARLSAVVDMIAKLTGREVKLVPPTAYLVSAPSGPEPAHPVELLAPLGLASQLRDQPGILEVDITSVLRTGTTERMLLDQKSAGQLQLHAALDVEL